MKTRSALSVSLFMSLTLYPSLSLSISLSLSLPLYLSHPLSVPLQVFIMANPFSDRSTCRAGPLAITLAIPFSVRGVPRLCRWADPMRMRR